MKKQFTNPTPIQVKPMTTEQVGKMLKGLYNKPEKKKIEKLDLPICDKKYGFMFTQSYFVQTISKINEIIDYINNS